MLRTEALRYLNIVYLLAYLSLYTDIHRLSWLGGLAQHYQLLLTECEHLARLSSVLRGTSVEHYTLGLRWNQVLGLVTARQTGLQTAACGCPSARARSAPRTEGLLHQVAPSPAKRTAAMRARCIGPAPQRVDEAALRDSRPTLRQAERNPAGM